MVDGRQTAALERDHSFECSAGGHFPHRRGGQRVRVRGDSEAHWVAHSY